MVCVWFLLSFLFLFLSFPFFFFFVVGSVFSDCFRWVCLLLFSVCWFVFGFLPRCFFFFFFSSSYRLGSNSACPSSRTVSFLQSSHLIVIHAPLLSFRPRKPLWLYLFLIIPSSRTYPPSFVSQPPIAYFEGVADIEANTSKELTKLGAVIQVPFKAGNQFLGEGGMQVS